MDAGRPVKRGHHRNVSFRNIMAICGLMASAERMLEYYIRSVPRI
jgi:hypothetical protein